MTTVDISFDPIVQGRDVESISSHLSIQPAPADLMPQDRLIPQQFFGVLEAVFGPILGQGKDHDALLRCMAASAMYLMRGLDHTARVVGIRPSVWRLTPTRETVRLMAPVLDRVDETGPVEMRRAVTSFCHAGPKAYMELRKRGALGEFVKTELGENCLKGFLVAHWCLVGIDYVVQSGLEDPQKTFSDEDCSTLVLYFQKAATEFHTSARARLAELQDASGENEIEWDPDAPSQWPNPEERNKAIADSFDRFVRSH